MDWHVGLLKGPDIPRVLMLVALGGLLTGCGRDSVPTTAPATQTTGQVYHVRGIVRGLPREGTSSPQLHIEHEAIPDFVDNFGQAVGMDSMTMPFDVASEVNAADLHIGDRIAFDLQVHWKENQIRITRIAPLPADTVLQLGPVHPPRHAPSSATR